MNLLPEQDKHLRLLLNHLENSNQQGNEFWQDWQITRLNGEGINRLFRTKHALGDCVVKFTIGDDRNRAEREFQALLALERVGLQIAPMPLLVDTSSYRQPVVWCRPRLKTTASRIPRQPMTNGETCCNTSW